MDRNISNKEQQDEVVKELNREIDVLRIELINTLRYSQENSEDLVKTTQQMTKVSNKLNKIEKSQIEARKREQYNYKDDLQLDIKKVEDELEDLRQTLHKHLINGENEKDYIQKLFYYSRKISRKSRSLHKLKADLSNL